MNAQQMMGTFLKILKNKREGVQMHTQKKQCCAFYVHLFCFLANSLKSYQNIWLVWSLTIGQIHSAAGIACSGSLISYIDEEICWQQCESRSKMDQSRETFIRRKDKQKHPICANRAQKRKHHCWSKLELRLSKKWK